MWGKYYDTFILQPISPFDLLLGTGFSQPKRQELVLKDARFLPAIDAYLCRISRDQTQQQCLERQRWDRGAQARGRKSRTELRMMQQKENSGAALQAKLFKC